MTSLALVFPGQGSQHPGMGHDLFERSPAARLVFEQADDTLGWALSRVCFEGPEATLRDTAISQPAIVTTSIAALAAIKERLAQRDEVLAPAFTAGHSVGQYAALVAGGVLDFASAIRLVGERGRLMKEAGQSSPGGMVAVLGLEDEAVEEVCRDARQVGTVCTANYNMPGQVVISGDNAALQAASRLALERGARKVIPLAVSVANHSPLMEQAAAQLRALLDDLPLRSPRVPLVANGSGLAISTVAAVRAELAQHMTAPVLWTKSVATMEAAAVQTYWELGPGQVLAGLIKRTVKNAKVISVGSTPDVDAIVT